MFRYDLNDTCGGLGERRNGVFYFQSTAYHATSKTRTVTKDVMSLRHGPIDPYGSDVWSGDRLEVPAVPPSFLVGCSIIDIRYILMVSMN